MKKSINIGKLLVIPYESYSNYINLPPSSLERLSKLNTTNTYFFEIKTSADIISYVGVKEFTSDESCIEVPSWLAESLGVDYVNITLMKDIPKGEYIKIEPLSKDFFDLPDNDKLVEIELAKYCLLELNQIIPMKILDKVYEFKIIEIKNNDIIDIINIDLNVDFENKFLETIPTNKVIPEKVKEKEKEKNDFTNMISENIQEPEKQKEICTNIIGGTVIDIAKVKEARLKYYENKLKINEEEKIEIVETKKELVEVQKELIEKKKELVEVQKELVEVQKELVEIKPELVEIKPKNKPKTKTKAKTDPEEKLEVKPKRKYTRKNKIIT